MTQYLGNQEVSAAYSYAGYPLDGILRKRGQIEHIAMPNFTIKVEKMKKIIIAMSVFISFDAMAKQPLEVGECAKTTVTEISSRLEGEAGSGSSITFENGAYIVGYEVVPEIENSKVGDTVKVCRQKPEPDFYEACPPGGNKDDWAVLYSVYNLRTKETFSGGSSSHIC